MHDSGEDTTRLTQLTLAWGVLAQGVTYCWDVQHKDNRGGWSESSLETCFMTLTDSSPPETTITAGPAEGQVRRSPVSFSWQGSDNVNHALKYSYQVDDGAWSAFSQYTSASFTLPDGPHTLRVFCRDETGNLDATPAERSFIIDNTAPTISAGGTSLGGFVFRFDYQAGALPFDVLFANPVDFENPVLASGMSTSAAPAPVPKPATLMLFGSGAACLALLRRKKKI